ncbi:hypothetical protein BZL29_3430 [Mycobacterium kansasii]|uniref:Uncharacterized protein n=1 Tax=Mycobacterium kansasii TaxID=1768 RepID=A0A1V3XCU4_MYCKA|nr:hypothetical protein BZL29_3430 [Mycobacterium kansasii]
MELLFVQSIRQWPRLVRRWSAAKVRFERRPDLIGRQSPIDCANFRSFRALQENIGQRDP